MRTSRSILAPAFGVVLFTGWLMAAPEAQTPGLPPPPDVPNNTAEYRRFTLPNDMKVLLLSDPKLNKSSAALTVGVGSLSDPADRQGLAHFLEHMLFLGTDKYPDVSAFDAYLKTNGGYNNAATWPDHTTYLLEIPHAAFEGALDRFSQFFIAPLFDPKFTEREMNAVNSEFQRHLENDGRRAYQVDATVYRPGHPMSHFGIGNRGTLTGTTREELLDFYHRHYSANVMSLALTGKASLDELEGWARKYFAAVPNHNVEPVRFPPDYLPEKAALRVVRVEAIKDERQLDIEFPLPSTTRYWQSKPAELLGYILGYEGEGGLLAQLKAEGLATGIEAGSYDFARSFTSFEIDVDLTPAGLEKHQRVLELVFAAIARMRQADYPARLFQERQTMGRLDEAYLDKGEGADRAVTLSTEAWQYPLEVAERVPYLWVKEDADAYRELLGRLRPDNMLVTLIARGLPTDKTEPYFKTKYSYTEQTGPAYEALVHPPEVASLHLPVANPYIPHEVAELPRQPVRLINEPALSLYYSQDTEFARPMVAEIFRLRLPRSLGTLENATLLMFYEACVNEALTETIYEADQAGLHVTLAADLEGGVELSLDGYSAAAPRLLDTVIDSLVNFKLTDERFAALKDRLVRPLEDFPLNEAYQISLQTRRAVEREFYFRPDEMLPAARKVTLADVRAFARKLYRAGRIEALVHGNVTADAAIAVARKLAGSLNTKGVPPEDLIRLRLLRQAPGDAAVSVEQVKGSNSAFRQEYVLDGDSPETRAATVVLSNAIEDPIYTELRTKQQLGYIVTGGAYEEMRAHSLVVLIQSAEHSADDLMARAEPVVQGLPDLVRNLSDEEWAALIAGARAQLEARDKTIAERAARLFKLAYDYAGEWGRREQTVAALDTLTKEQAAAMLATAIAPKTQRVRTFLIYGRNHQPSAGIKPTFADREAWKKKQSFE